MMRCAAFERDLSVGSHGDDVMQLQQMLSGDGFLQASSTGYFGRMTAQALGAFQMHFGISSSTGSFGPMTRQFLMRRCGGNSNDGGMGSSTMMWQGHSGDASSTTSMMPMPCGMQTMMGYMASGTGPMMHPCGGMMGSSTQGTMIIQPCGPGMNGATTTTQDQSASVAVALFMPHTILPGMQDRSPCHGEMMPPPQASSTPAIPPMMPAQVQGQSR